METLKKEEDTQLNTSQLSIIRLSGYGNVKEDEDELMNISQLSIIHPSGYGNVKEVTETAK